MQNDPRYYVRVALEAFQQRDRDRAADAIANLIRQRAPIGTTWGPIARMAKTMEETSLAVAAQRNHIAENPADLRRQWELALMYISAGRVDEAMAIGRDLVAKDPKQYGYHQLLGNAYAQAGKTEPATEALRIALKLNPHAAESWLSFSQQKKFTLGDPDATAMRDALQSMPVFPKSPRGILNYAYAKVLDDLGHDADAFEAYERGAKLLAQESKYDRAASEAFVAEVTSRWNADFIRGLSPSRETSDRVVFVLGIPRSGTTLTEQIFVAHSAFHEGAETALFNKAALAFPDFRPSTVTRVAAEPRWNGDIWSRVGSAYQHLIRDRFGHEGKIVDKTLSYTRYVGALAQALPNAKFVWVRREPPGCAWSCFRTCFATGIDWSWSLSDIGHHFRLEDKLYAHWTALFPDRILTLPYEELVQDPDTWIPRMLAFVGLEDEPQTRNFHETKRVVRTASTNQVRKPLYTSSVTGWRRYEAQMKPFFDAYNAA